MTDVGYSVVPATASVLFELHQEEPKTCDIHKRGAVPCCIGMVVLPLLLFDPKHTAFSSSTGIYRAPLRKRGNLPLGSCDFNPMEKGLTRAKRNHPNHLGKRGEHVHSTAL